MYCCNSVVDVASSVLEESWKIRTHDWNSGALEKNDILISWTKNDPYFLAVKSTILFNFFVQVKNYRPSIVGTIILRCDWGRFQQIIIPPVLQYTYTNYLFNKWCDKTFPPPRIALWGDLKTGRENRTKHKVCRNIEVAWVPSQWW